MSLQKDRQGMIEIHREVCSCSMRRDGTAGAFIKQCQRLLQSWAWQSLLQSTWGSVAGWDILGVAQQRRWENACLDIQPLLRGSWWKRLAARRVRQKEHCTTESFSTAKGVSGEITGWWALKKKPELPNASKHPVGNLMAAERDSIKESDKSCCRRKMRKYLKYFPLICNLFFV